MCGLFGAVTRGFLTYSERDLVRQLAVMAQLRGTDSTGMVTVRQKKNKKIAFNTIKRVANSSVFLEDPAVSKMWYEDKVFVIAGHTRKATCGAVNETNAHPIHAGKILGMHNGVIPHFNPHKHEEEYRTDSKAFIERIAEYSLQDAIEEAGTGAYALVYIDQEKRTIHFTRNHQRPLHYMWDIGCTTMYWASEKGALDYLRDREGQGSFKEPMVFNIGYHYHMKLGEELSLKREQLVPERARPIPGTSIMALPKPDTEVRPVIFCTQCKRRKEYCYCSSYPAKDSAPVTLEEYFKKKYGGTSVPVVQGTEALKRIKYRGWDRKEVRGSEVFDILKHGCCGCRAPQTLLSSVFWLSQNKVVCKECMNNKMIYQYVRDSFNRMFPGSIVEGSFASDRKQ